MKRNTGFTLIELLIVVLIIAILAAIAVPNFLEFQTRAKVSRVMSDMRNTALALEAYSVDNDRYIIGITEGERLGMWNRAMITFDMNIMWFRMTTPIAYITTVPIDIFTEQTGALAGGSTFRNYRGFWYWNWHYDQNGANEKAINNLGYEYVIRSWGPDKAGTSPWEAEILQNQLTANVYDPTNGTISQGFIMRTNKGYYAGPGS